MVNFLILWLSHHILGTVPNGINNIDGRALQFLICCVQEHFEEFKDAIKRPIIFEDFNVLTAKNWLVRWPHVQKSIKSHLDVQCTLFA